MKKIFISPHDDDQALFGSYTCIREKPLIIFVLDSYIQPNRGEIGCSNEERSKESAIACSILGCDHVRLGLHDDTATYTEIVEALKLLKFDDLEIVYAPMLQVGNKHHDMLNVACLEVFGPKVIQYPTYTREKLYTEATIEVKPTPEEELIKEKALSAYQSQIRINKPHFDAVMGKSEWLLGNRKLNLGSGKKPKTGWVNMDMLECADVVADITKGIPFPDNEFDVVFSEDFMEHLPPEKKVFVINEIWRVLKSGGVMEHVIPNAGSRNDFGSPSHLSHWNLQQFEHFDVDSYRYNLDRDYEGFIGGFRKIYAGYLSWDEEDKKYQAINVKYQAVK